MRAVRAVSQGRAGSQAGQPPCSQVGIRQGPQSRLTASPERQGAGLLALPRLRLGLRARGLSGLPGPANDAAQFGAQIIPTATIGAEGQGGISLAGAKAEGSGVGTGRAVPAPGIGLPVQAQPAGQIGQGHHASPPADVTPAMAEASSRDRHKTSPSGRNSVPPEMASSVRIARNCAASCTASPRPLAALARRVCRFGMVFSFRE